MVPPDDKEISSKVSANDCMPHGLARASHAHSEWQQGKQCSAPVIVAIKQNFIRPHASIVVDVSGLSNPSYRMKQQRTINLLYGTLGDFFVCAMNRISCLKCNNITVTQLSKSFASF